MSSVPSNLPPGPWSYMPNEYDDWGFVRDANGNLVANTCVGGMHIKFYAEVKYGTEEYWRGPPQARAVAELLIRARELVPADNAEPITRKWLKSAGASEDEHSPLKWTFYRDSGLPIGLWDVADGWKVMLLHSDAAASCIIRGLKTRGDVRALLKGLKLPLSPAPRQESA